MPTVAGGRRASGCAAGACRRPRWPRGSATSWPATSLADHADHPAHLLSGGQKQLLALASVLVTEPSVLVLDEPTTLLDLRNARRVAGPVAGLAQQVVLVTHHLDLLDGFDRVLVFDEAPARPRRAAGRRGGALPGADGVSHASGSSARAPRRCTGCRRGSSCALLVAGGGVVPRSTPPGRRRGAGAGRCSGTPPRGSPRAWCSRQARPLLWVVARARGSSRRWSAAGPRASSSSA